MLATEKYHGGQRMIHPNCMDLEFNRLGENTVGYATQGTLMTSAANRDDFAR